MTELSLSCIVLSFCGVFTVNWYYVLFSTVIDEDSLRFVQSVTEEKWHSMVLGLLWFGGLLGVLQKRPGPKDPAFPNVIYVELEVGYEEPKNPLANLLSSYPPSPSEARYWQQRKDAKKG